MMHHLTQSHDFTFVLQSSGIQNKQPLFTVYPLYKYQRLGGLSGLEYVGSPEIFSGVYLFIFIKMFLLMN
jgi:hypothetical protein